MKVDQQVWPNQLEIVLIDLVSKTPELRKCLVKALNAKEFESTATNASSPEFKSWTFFIFLLCYGDDGRTWAFSNDFADRFHQPGVAVIVVGSDKEDMSCQGYIVPVHIQHRKQEEKVGLSTRFSIRPCLVVLSQDREKCNRHSKKNKNDFHESSSRGSNPNSVNTSDG